MNKQIIVLILMVILGISALIWGKSSDLTKPDFKSATYTIDGVVVKLGDGQTNYFGNELIKDLNGDGREDVAFILTHSPGGSGTFYYVVAALNTESGYVGSQGLLLGDRIAPQTTESGPGKTIIVNYADRKLEEPMTTPPSVGKSLRLLLDENILQFGEVVVNFEGEADPTRLSLGMQTWTFISAQYNNSEEFKPKKIKAFTITFGNDGRFSATTDCNSMGGSYTANGRLISFSDIMSTLMYCPESQETEFNNLLQNIVSYHFTSHGELIFDLKFDSGAAIFR